MTVRLSPHKITKMMRYYFSGLSESEAAAKLGIDQSTVSLYVSRFKNRANEIGLVAAGKEFMVLNEVDSLRSLSVELSKAGLTVE
jgi:predicted transcriptional regulator